MRTTAINVDTQLYNDFALCAEQQHSSAEKMLEQYMSLIIMQAAKKKEPKYSKLSPVIERLGNLKLREFTQEELSEDPRLEYLMNNFTE
jgi:hypothetical protein